MRRSAISAAVFGVALFVLLFLLLGPGCGPERSLVQRQADEAWKLYLAQPDPDTYENFIRANRTAAGRHDSPHDREGIEYQLRALDVMSREAERLRDLRLADDVTERIADIESHDLAGVYEETVGGAKERLEAAKARASAVSR